MTGQTKKGSFVESMTNLVTDITIGVISQMIVWPLVGIEADIQANFIVVIWFTVVNWLRVYVVRRWFNLPTVRQYYTEKDDGN